MEIRQQKINKRKSYSALKVPKTIADSVDPHAFTCKLSQEEDHTLTRVRHYVL